MSQLLETVEKLGRGRFEADFERSFAGPDRMIVYGEWSKLGSARLRQAGVTFK